MPAPYTESFTGLVARVWSGDEQHPHQIILRDATRSTHRFYSWNAWVLNFCEQRAKDQRAVTLDYSTTAYGRLIDAIDYVDPEQEQTA